MAYIISILRRCVIPSNLWALSESEAYVLILYLLLGMTDDAYKGYMNEESVGRAIYRSGLARSELYITTKLHYYTRPGESPLEKLKESLEKVGDYESQIDKMLILKPLPKLRLGYVDLYLIHSPPAPEQIPVVWKEFEEAKKLGLARSIGVSNFTVEQLEIFYRPGVAQIKPAINQVCSLTLSPLLPKDSPSPALRMF